MLNRLIVLLSFCSTVSLWGQVIDFPNPPTGQVLDTGSWLGSERLTRLEDGLGRYRKGYGIDVMIILWDRGLPPETGLEELARRLGETWAREDLWVVILHVPDSLHRPALVCGGVATERFAKDAVKEALLTATLRGMKERTTRAQVEALGLEAGEEFVFLKARADFEHKLAVAARDQQIRDRESRHQAMILRAVVATLLALIAVAVVAVLCFIRRRPSNFTFPETRWRRRLGAQWSGGGHIVVSLPPRVA